ncbi:hypothetical protein [Vibrio parahaemolyticus]|uniref:hypothetical protein n=1 Tax=Vibrio parahaemolyticus TaxID=670 RepID=UPI00111CEFAA|nr:hypothetical protein [Vibrio parahaemolyticus]TOQ01795.1 hypothetical protein CGH05_04275 [Vibrio parahaemolyticus]HCE4995372.1 hypothetical protein [Vibrio parahaemolyticus]HCE5205397.1 hypothetical protein [Vibrio parahaemolyticus]
MVTRREQKREKTKERFLSALSRLVEGNAEYVAEPYDINPYTVEREAKLSVGSLRHYPELKKIILDAASDNGTNSNDASEMQQVVVEEPEQLEQLEQLTGKLKAEIKKIKEAKRELEFKLERAEVALNQQQKIEVELIMAIHSSLSPKDRQRLYASKAKLIQFPSGNDLDSS